MKTLNKYINETLVRLQSDRINEWKANTNFVSSIDEHDMLYFVYKTNIKHNIRIFGEYWLNKYNTYKDKVYINGEHIKLDKYGYTEISFSPGKYNVYIKDINDITNCKNMFWNCTDLIKVPLFDTSKVENMYLMFYNCQNLEDVPLFDTSKVRSMHRMFCACQNLKVVPKFNTKKVEDMNDMFYKCEMLNEQTKQIWSQVYNFDTHKKK